MPKRPSPSSTSLWKILTLTLGACASFGARADLLQECNAIASTINRSTPQQIDQVTKLMNAICVADGRSVMLIYRNQLGVPNGAVSQSNLDGIRPRMVKAWCTDPDQLTLLKMVDIQYTYSYPDGRMVGKINISRRDC